MGNPLPPGYFLGRETYDESWVQFKYEKLGVFYYECGMLNHITGWCLYANAATITMVDGVLAQIYRPWLREEHIGNLLFVNTSSKEAILQDFDESRKIFELQQTSNFLTSESQRLDIAVVDEDKTEEEIQNAVETC